MDSQTIRIINGMQTGFPLELRPFASVGTRLHLSEETIIQGIRNLLETGFLTRFGPFFNAERLGGGLTLAAIRVPDDDYATVAEIVNAQPEVAHNYAREHALNMWFVVATEKRPQIDEVLNRITALTGLEVFDLPKLEEFRLGFAVRLGEDGAIDTHPQFDPAVDKALTNRMPDDLDRAIITATQAGLPLEPTPYHRVAATVGVGVENLMHRLEEMLRRGWIRRIGLATNHYRLGLKGNGMSVWNLPDDQVTTLGQRIAGLDFVTHCYRRPRHPPTWPYNLFVMVHGADRAMVGERIGLLEELLGPANQGHLVLHSSRILKKTGLRLRTSGGVDGCSV
ncbi:MAG: Lrp/AsnC family transcriptional regulator [Magnetococcales bacterium]|nr:Lrp/AsnC family transcriptional regulator [Magnetococcales bacterium]